MRQRGERNEILILVRKILIVSTGQDPRRPDFVRIELNLDFCSKHYWCGFLLTCHSEKTNFISCNILMESMLCSYQ